MLVWLPPSEGKTPPGGDTTLSLDSLLFPELTEARHQAIKALSTVSARADAPELLGLGPKTAAECALNLTLYRSPCTPAIDLYTGVLYDALDYRTLSTAARDALEQKTWILSALFGFVRPTDLLPNHRVAMGVKLSPLGSLAPWWRSQLRPVLDEQLTGETIFDCRPGAYRSAYPAKTAHVIELAVVKQGPKGRSAVTHQVKQWRGWAARWLLESGAEPLDALSQLRGQQNIVDVEVGATKHHRSGGTTTLVKLVTD